MLTDVYLIAASLIWLAAVVFSFGYMMLLPWPV